MEKCRTLLLWIGLELVSPALLLPVPWLEFGSRESRWLSTPGLDLVDSVLVDPLDPVLVIWHMVPLMFPLVDMPESSLPMAIGPPLAKAMRTIPAPLLALELALALALHPEEVTAMDIMLSLMVFRLGSFPIVPLRKLPLIVQLPRLEMIPLVPTVPEFVIGWQLLNVVPLLACVRLVLSPRVDAGVELVFVSIVDMLLVLTVPVLEAGPPVQPMHTPPLHARLLPRSLWP